MNWKLKRQAAKTKTQSKLILTIVESPIVWTAVKSFQANLMTRKIISMIISLNTQFRIVYNPFKINVIISSNFSVEWTFLKAWRSLSSFEKSNPLFFSFIVRKTFFTIKCSKEFINIYFIVNGSQDKVALKLHQTSKFFSH